MSDANTSSPVLRAFSPEAGTLLTPNIRLERPLARGAMGSVWLADHLGLQTKVVVKFIAEELAGRAEVLVRFQREAAAASQVKSPHVVQMFDHGVSAAGLAYITMELLEGCTLGEHLAAHRVLPGPQVATVVGQVAKALGRAHEKGVVHRDIKPDNIFLCDDGRGDAFIKVLDFGIAKVSDTGNAGNSRSELGNFGATRTGVMLGTPYYMSPEQVVGAKTLDHRADLWALAVVAYEMLTGYRPFDGETMGAIAVAICSADFQPPQARNVALTPAIDAFFASALARDIDKRFASARELAEALEQATLGAQPLALMPALIGKVGEVSVDAATVGDGAGQFAESTQLASGTSSGAVGTPSSTYSPTVASLPGPLPPESKDTKQKWDRLVAFGFLAALVLGSVIGVTYLLSRPSTPSTSGEESDDSERRVKRSAVRAEEAPEYRPRPSASASSTPSTSAPASSPTAGPETTAASSPTPSPSSSAERPYFPGKKPKRKHDKHW